MFGPAEFFHPLTPAYPTHHQVLISQQHSLFTQSRSLTFNTGHPGPKCTGGTLVLKHGVCEGQTTTSTKIQQQKLFRFRSGRQFLTITPLQVLHMVHTSAVNSPSKTKKSSVEAPTSKLPKDFKKVGYSALLFSL